MSLVSHPELFPKISSRFPAGGDIYTFTRSGSQSLSRDFPAGLTRLDLRVKWRVWPRPSVGAVPGSFFRHDIRNELKAPLMRQQLPTNSATTKVKNKLKISYLFLDVIYFVQHMTCANLPPAPQMGSPPNRRWIRWTVRDMVHLAFCQAMRTAPPTAHRPLLDPLAARCTPSVSILGAITRFLADRSEGATAFSSPSRQSA